MFLSCGTFGLDILSCEKLYLSHLKLFLLVHPFWFTPSWITYMQDWAFWKAYSQRFTSLQLYNDRNRFSLFLFVRSWRSKNCTHLGPQCSHHNLAQLADCKNYIYIYKRYTGKKHSIIIISTELWALLVNIPIFTLSGRWENSKAIVTSNHECFIWIDKLTRIWLILTSIVWCIGQFVATFLPFLMGVWQTQNVFLKAQSHV